MASAIAFTRSASAGCHPTSTAAGNLSRTTFTRLKSFQGFVAVESQGNLAVQPVHPPDAIGAGHEASGSEVGTGSTRRPNMRSALQTDPPLPPPRLSLQSAGGSDVCVGGAFLLDRVDTHKVFLDYDRHQDYRATELAWSQASASSTLPSSPEFKPVDTTHSSPHKAEGMTVLSDGRRRTPSLVPELLNLEPPCPPAVPHRAQRVSTTVFFSLGPEQSCPALPLRNKTSKRAPDDKSQQKPVCWLALSRENGREYHF